MAILPVPSSRYYLSHLDALPGPHAVTEVRAEFERIVRDHPGIATARPALQKLAIEAKVRPYELVDAYLASRPHQLVTCGRCGVDHAITDQVRGRCFDCLLLDHFMEP